MEKKLKNDSYSDENKLTNLSKIFYNGFLLEKEICYDLSSYKKHNFSSLKEMKKVMLQDFINTLKEPNKTEYCNVSDHELKNVIINSCQLDYILVQVSNSYYKPDSIFSENFNEKLEELKENYGGENISPTAAVCFLSAIKKNDLTTGRFGQVVSAVEIREDDPEDFYWGLLGKIDQLIENLNQDTVMPDKFVDIIAFFARIYPICYIDDYDLCERRSECVYKTICQIIINSKKYKNANGDKQKEADAIKGVLDPEGFCQNFWIVLRKLRDRNNFGQDISFSNWLTTKKIQERALMKYGDEYRYKYAKKLNDLLMAHDIYISSQEKFGFGFNKERICIEARSYQAIKKQTQNDFNAIMKNVINDFEKDNIVRYDWYKGTISYNKKTYQIQDEKIDSIRKVVTQICQDQKDFFCKSDKCQIFDIDVLTDDVQSIQKIIEGKQTAEINKIKSDFSNLVNKKIERHKNKQRAIFKLENNKVYLDIGEFSDEWIDISSSTNKIDDIVATWVEKFAECRFYRKIEIDENMKNDLTSKLKMVLNEQYQNHLEKIPNLMKTDCVNGIIQCNKIGIESINPDNTGEEKKDKLEKSENKTGLIENGVNKKIENINTNTDENKNQNEIKMKNRKENNEIENGTKNETIEELSNQDKTVVNQENENINSKTDENKIQENPNNIKSQTLGLSHTNNQDQSGTKNKCWIKFFKALKIIAFVGFILALAMTVLSIFIASLSSLIIKFVIATVVLFCIFLVSQFLISCLFNKKPRENKNPYLKQIDTGIETKENQDKLYTNRSMGKLNINQIYEEEKNNLPFIEDSLSE